MMPYDVTRIPAKQAMAYIHHHHYSHGSHNGPSPCYGLFNGDALIGALMFATPCSENVRKSVFGEAGKNGVVELHRLHILDVTPQNSESWFIARCLRAVAVDRPQTRAVVSFADATEGHRGTIYRATNGLFYGMSAPAWFWIDQSGRLRHPRQCGVNAKGEELGWTRVRRAAKYRYFWLVGDRRQRAMARKELLLVPQPYPDDDPAMEVAA